MATALDLLMSAKEDVNLLSEESDICTIDAKTRIIFVPSTIVVGGVQSDKNAERIKFSCPKIVGDNLDLSKFSVRINFENVSSVDFNVSIKDQYICDDVAVDGENATFSWLIGRNAARYMGTVRFIVCAVKTDSDSNISVEWNTTIAEVPVLEGIEIDQPQIGQEEKDVINQLLELTKNTSAEAVQNVNSAKEQAIKDIQSVSQPDTTLTIEGGLAEAKATGEAIGSLKEDLVNTDKTIYTQKNNIESRNGYYVSEKLEFKKSEQWSSLFLPIIGTIKETHVKVKGTNLYFYKDIIPSIAFFDENKVLISAKYEAIMPNVPVEIPDNSAYVVMNSLSGTFSVEFFSILNQIKNLEKTHGNGNLLSKKCDGEEIKGYGLYTNEQPFYQYENSSVIRYALEKNKKYVFPSGNTSYKLVNGNPENYSMYFNSNGKNEFVNIFGAEFCYVDRIDHDVKIYGRELYEDTITNKNSVFCNTEIKGTDDGLFYFHPFNIRKGDRIYAWRYSSIDDKNIALFLSNEKRASADIESKSIKFTDGYVEYVAEKDWGGFTTWANGMNGKRSYKYLIAIERKKGNDTSKTVVCAANSSEWDKLRADYICTGLHDEIVINEAINRVKKQIGTVELCDGDYYIDGFSDYLLAGKTEKVAICVKKDAIGVGVTLTGKSTGKPQNAVLHVNESAFDGLNDEAPSVISGGSSETGYVGGCGFNVRHLKIELPNTKHKCIAVNYQHSYWGIIDSCTLTCLGFGQDNIPVEGLIGLRGWAGWSDGSIIGAYDTYASGFRVAFQLGGEHVICERLGARFCYTSYTFGEYPLDAHSGAQVHPITIINCCDEHQATLPKFFDSGNADSRNAGRCQVDFIGFNIEYYPLITGTPIVGATEVTDGGWVGRIEYSVENNENNANVTIPFWAEGHGKNFRTLNTAQKQMGTTDLRKTFAANYMQQYFDTDLNKVVYCKEPSTKTWIDANGNNVD